MRLQHLRNMILNQQKKPLRYSILFSALFLSAQSAYAVLETIHVESSAKTKAQEGKDQVYLKDQVTEYKSKAEIDTYQGHSVADLLSGFNGVYSGDARNSGALAPNIRGVQGQGRIPVLIDDTEQAITVWRGYAGVTNRNYLDPFLIGNISVEKGASLSRDLNTGAAGTIRMQTLNPDDIIRPGHQYGLEVKIETTNNSIKQKDYPLELNQDYRTIANPYETELEELAPYFRTADRYEARSKGRNKFFRDNAFRIAGAVKDEKYEMLAAYAYRKKGNYYAGKGGAKRYGEGKTLEDYFDDRSKVQSSYNDDPYVPWIAIAYNPKKEVPNTSIESESSLFKVNFFPSADQKIKFGLRHTNIEYGEIMPSRLGQTLYQRGTVLQWPLAHVKQTAVNLDYEYNPDNPWLNLKLGVWGVRNNATTNTAGGSPGDILHQDLTFSFLPKDPLLEPYPEYGPEYMAKLHELLKMYPNIPNSDFADYYKEKYVPNKDGIFNTQPAHAQISRDNHWGIHASNHFELQPNLSLDVMANYKQETIASDNILTYWSQYRDTHPELEQLQDENRIYAFNLYPNHLSGYRYGKRKEFNAGLNFTYTPTDWLMLTAGAKYTHYRSVDDGLKRRLRGQKREDILLTTAIPYTVTQLATEEEANLVNKKPFDYQRTEEENRIAEGVIGTCRSDKPNICYYIKKVEQKFYWYRDELGRFSAKTSPFYNGTITQEMLDEKSVAYGKLPTTNDDEIEAIPDQYKIHSILSEDEIKAPPTPEQWATMLKAERKDHAWAPSFGATFFVTDNIRVYARYNETKRMPSIFEDTIGFSLNEITGFYKRKPEHSKNIELGYVHDLRGVFPHLHRADFRINYFHNSTSHIFDRNENYELEQYDKRILSGLELQARYDQGNFFTDIGVTYNLKNKLCDASENAHYSEAFGTNERRIHRFPKCFNGGNGNGYLRHTILPKYTIVGNVGVRLLDERLTMGTRMVYHTNVKETYEKSLRDAGFTNGPSNTLRWQPVLVVDAYANYAFTENLQAELVGTNITDRYYLDPITQSTMPAPGRTVKLGLNYKF